MSRSPEKTSPIEKEKLRKRLQKLFHSQERKKTDHWVNHSEYHNSPNVFHPSKIEMKLNGKKGNKPKQSPTYKKFANQQDSQQKENNGDKKPVANESFKNKKSQQKSKSKHKTTQQSKGKKVLQLEKNKTNDSAQANTVKLETNSNAKKGAKKFKNFRPEDKTLPDKFKQQTPKPKNKQFQGEEYKADTSASNKPPATNGSSSKTNANEKNNNERKRKALADTANEQSATNKKLKLNYKTSKNNRKGTKHINYDSSSDEKDVYDIKNMKGLVLGGDFDEDFDKNVMDDEYWLNHYNSDESDSSGSFFKEQELLEHTLPYSDIEEEQVHYNSNSDDEYRSNWDFEDEECVEEEEEEHHYSDYDEDDYELDAEEDYSYDEEEYSSDYNGNDSSYEFNYDEHDEDYHLPKHIPEDLIIHRGTATKRDIKPADNVSFNSDHEGAQIIELQKQKNIKVIQQPKECDREELIKLKYCKITEKDLTTEILASLKVPDDAKDCPKLVSMVDEDGFQLYNSNEEEVEEEDYEEENETAYEYEDYDEMSDHDMSLGSEYMELDSDDADSLLSEDINDKYLNRGANYSDEADEIDDSGWFIQQKVDIIDAINCTYENKKQKDVWEESEESINDDIKQLPSVRLYENVDLKTASRILSTTIIDNTEEDNQQILTSEETSQDKESIEPLEGSNESKSSHETVLVKNSRIENQQNERVKSSYVQSLVNYNTKFFNAFDSNLVLVLLKDPFYIYGTVRLTLLAGNVEIYGHILSLNKEVELFSPRGCSVIEIAPQAKSKISSSHDIKDALKDYEKHFALADLNTICDTYDSDHDAVVLLKRNEARKKLVQQFKKFCNENVFPNLHNINVDRPLYNTEYILRCMINTSSQELKCLCIPQQWQQLSISSESRVMLTGGKGVGKSTLLRYLINSCLPKHHQILLIDLDIGQPEVFIPQTVSCTVVRQPFLGPGFMLTLEPDISYAVGHTNIILCAHKYLKTVRNLISYCLKEEKYKGMPWLINTMGYNKGFGLELISVIVKEFANLTDLIQLQSAKEINNFDAVLYPHVLKNVPRDMFDADVDNECVNLAETKDYRLHVWQSAVQQESRYQKEWEMSAKDLRFAMLLTRLSQALQGHAEWLTDCKPLSAPLDMLKIINLMDNTFVASTEELTKSLEANLVYLCHYEGDNNPLKCLGIGVVRAVDFHLRQVYLLPAMSYTLLKTVNCLALGEMCLPTSIFTNQGPRIKNTAPFVYNTIEANASKAIKQIYHRPRRFLTGKRKSIE